MSTGCLIAKQVGEDNYKTIYCHTDGYLTHAGAVLVDFYNTEQKVDELLEVGDLSVLKERLYPNPLYTHTFDERQEGVSVAYGRDRGEQNAGAKVLCSEAFHVPVHVFEYVYVFDLEQQWKYARVPELELGLKDVKEDLQKEYAAYDMERPKGYYGDLYDEMAALLKMKTGQIEEPVETQGDVSEMSM